MPSILVDAGPLIALVNPVDKHHKPVKAYLRRFNGRLLTTWPVFAEVCHFLPEQMQIAFLRWADGGGIGVVELHESALAMLADWKEKYRDLPMDLADASLIWVAQQTGVLDILTIDRKDFSVYRIAQRQIAPPGVVGRSFDHPVRLQQHHRRGHDEFATLIHASSPLKFDEEWLAPTTMNRA